jgi:hypothetical protein
MAVKLCVKAEMYLDSLGVENAAVLHIQFVRQLFERSIELYGRDGAQTRILLSYVSKLQQPLVASDCENPHSRRVD